MGNKKILQFVIELPLSGEGQTGSLPVTLSEEVDVPELLTSLLIWIAANSNLEHDGTSLPRVVMASAQTLHEMAFGENFPKAIRSGKYKVSGLYNDIENTIYLVDTTDLTTEGGKALLVHELVHYLQHTNGRTNDHELRVLEPLAYLLEANWLQARLYAWREEIANSAAAGG